MNDSIPDSEVPEYETVKEGYDDRHGRSNLFWILAAIAIAVLAFWLAEIWAIT